MKQSEYPDDSDDYSESDRACPQCKNVTMWVSSWWDDPVENGGACIGEIYTCGNCGHFEYH